MTTAFLKQIHKPDPKLPNCDYCLPKDVLAMLDANRDFYKNDSSHQSILLNPTQQGADIFFSFSTILQNVIWRHLTLKELFFIQKEIFLIIFSWSGLRINFKNPQRTDEEQITFDYGERLLKQTPKFSWNITQFVDMIWYYFNNSSIVIT